MLKISFIGAGHVAWHLSQALENAGHSVQEVFSRNPCQSQRRCFLFV
jgi:3-hydroxyisobutyrate dehydrogenase-like beta-hydroxyacid dehydrogenase